MEEREGGGCLTLGWGGGGINVFFLGGGMCVVVASTKVGVISGRLGVISERESEGGGGYFIEGMRL